MWLECGLNASGQISLSRYKEVIKLTHQLKQRGSLSRLGQKWNRDLELGAQSSF